jgi:hypothetical protein
MFDNHSYLKKNPAFVIKVGFFRISIITKAMYTMTTRPLYEIAAEIKSDWQKVYFGAVPYLDAMSTLNSINDNYIFDSGKSIVCYFLSNATTWKGDTARRVKAELKKMAGIK